MTDWKKWARDNLEPERQEEFFAELEEIKKDCERTEQWLNNTEEALGLTTEHKDFLHKHDIYISTAYIGMVRFYKDNRTIFQTTMFNLYENKSGGLSQDYDNMTIEVHDYLNSIMSATPELQEQLLMTNLPLFGAD